MTAFDARPDLEAYGSNALLLFAVQLRWGITDIDGVAAVALTDAANDKKCDLVYVDRDGGRVVVAQGYFAQNDVAAAPANKAADLNTAVSWLLQGPLGGLPEILRSAAEEVRDAITQEQIREFHVWFTHNAPESQNVQDELEQAAWTADALLRERFDGDHIDVSALEVGRAQLERLYERTEPARRDPPAACRGPRLLSTHRGLQRRRSRASPCCPGPLRSPLPQPRRAGPSAAARGARPARVT